MSAQSPIPRLNLEGLKSKNAGDYLVRFAFGAAVSLIAALVSMKFHLFGGMFLAFPAVLPASLTLIERDLGKNEAGIDAQGAIIGAIGLLAFALVATFGIKAIGAILALMVAAATWLVVAIGLYTAVMAWRAVTMKRRRKAAPG